jgi:hypothetical protein
LKIKTAFANEGTGKQTSSIIEVVPLRLIPATVGSVSLRIFHKIACSVGSLVKHNGVTVCMLEMEFSI